MGILSGKPLAIASLLCVTVLLSPIGAGGGEAVEEYRLKGAFLYNFAKFVRWPGQLTQGLASLRVCIQGSSEAHAAVMASFAGKTASGLPVEVHALGPEGSAGSCQLVFVTRDARMQARQLAGSVSGKPVLLVGESPDFARDGGMIGFVEEESKLRFEVNVSAVEKAGLAVSSHLLKLARVVDN